MSSDMNANTPEGVLAYCDYLISKGYATAAQVNPWRTAIQKVFETVEGDGWAQLDLSSIDLDAYAGRFQTLAGSQYKSESIATYKRRVGNALDAHEHYRTTGRPPSFRQRSTSPKSAGVEKSAEAKIAPSKPAQNSNTPAAAANTTQQTQAPGMLTFTFPLTDGKLATFVLPQNVKGEDVNRMSMFLRSLQIDPQIRSRSTLPPAASASWSVGEETKGARKGRPPQRAVAPDL